MDLKADRDIEFLIALGRAFHKDGPATEKEWRPWVVWLNSFHIVMKVAEITSLSYCESTYQEVESRVH